jgi:V8-like Glu-specific endopeptidase
MKRQGLLVQLLCLTARQDSVTLSRENATDVTFRIRLLAAAGLAAATALTGATALVAAGTAPRPAAAPHPFLHAQRALATRSGYWTSARMAAARQLTPLDSAPSTSGSAPDPSGGPSVRGAAWNGGGVVARSTGRAFFTLDGIAYACSGAVVNGISQDIMITAAHCVSDGSGGWADNFIFVPGYQDGRAPYGSYPAQTFYVSAQWTHGADTDDDVAFVALGQANVDGEQQDAGTVAGGLPIAFDYRAQSATAFGYPAEPPYTGGQLDYCAGPVSPDPLGSTDVGIGCDMTEGDSGGPWLSGFDPQTGIGVITGVTSFKYSGDASVLYSATLGQVAQALYTHAELPDAFAPGFPQDAIIQRSATAPRSPGPA